MASAHLAQGPGELPLHDPGTELPIEGTGPSLVLAGFECSLATVPLDRLERTARDVGDRWLTEGYEGIEGTREVTVLGTCCRRELWLVANGPEAAERWRSRLPGAAPEWRARYGQEAVRHLFRVAGGCESIVFGEKEVRSQVRVAARQTLSRHQRRVLKDLFEEAVGAAEAAAPAVPVSRSISALAAERLLEACVPGRPRVVIVGAGVVGRQVVERLGPRARISLVYRERAPDESFLRAHEARAIPTEALRDELREADAVVTAVKSGARSVGPDDLPADRPIVVVDLGIPRNVDPIARTLPNVRLIDLDDLRGSGRPPDAPATEASLRSRADAAFGRLERLAVEPGIARARRHAESLRSAELATARRFLGQLTPEQERAVERLTRRLVEQLLRGPTERLRQIPPGPEGDRFRRFALELLSTPAP